MSTTPKPSKFDLSNLIFKIEGIKLKLENPPKRGKISVTLQAKKDNTMPDKKDSVIESNHEKVNGEMEWKMNTDIVLDGRGLILVDIKEHHRSNPFASKSLVPNQFSLKNEDIFDTFVKSGVTGDTQEFILPEEHLTIILSLSCHSLENILKTFSPPQSLVSRLGKYQAGLDLMLQIATVLGGLNSKAGVVIGAVTQAFELLKSQEKCHKDILDLFAHMGDMLSVIADADPLKQHSKRVGGLIESTLNCIKDAVEQVLLKCRENMLKQLIFSSELAETISGFRDEFDNLREKYKLVLTQVTALLTLSSENARILMERLKPQPREGYKTCVDATRVSLLSDLVKSIKENSIVLLHGLAGTGKSSVMGSLEQKFHQRPVDSNLTGIELAVSFHCTRGTRSQDLSVLVPTLVYNIAQKFPAFGIYLANNLGIATSGGLYYQFKNLLHQPLASLKEENEYPTSQILVIIDALDEWAQDDESRKVFLVEIQRLCKNHDWLHFMITSRPNAEIMEALSSGKHLKTIDIQQDPNTQSDIENFLKQCLRTDKTMKQTITPDDELWLLSYVQSLFILADTAFKFLAQGLDPRKQLNILKKTQNGSKSGLNSYDVLYNLYTTVLEEAIQNPQNDKRDYLNILGILFILQKPVTENALKKFTGEYAKRVVESFSAVLYKSRDGKLNYHLSFKEFFQDEGVKRGFEINLKEQHRHLADACLKVLMDQLRFNICHLEDSCIANEFVSNPGIGERVKQHISDELQYSCESWVHHLCETETPDHKMLEQVVQLMTGQMIVYWMECLSLMGKTSHIRDSMDNLSDRRRSKNINANIMQIAEEIRKCVWAFHFPIAHSTPHLYLSVLPMIPEKSVIYHYLHGYCNKGIKIKQEGKHQSWVSEISQILHDREVTSASYSPDGKYIVSGCRDQTVRIWNAETGQPVGEPLKGHTHSVLSVAYSPDGKHIVSCSHDETVRIWNAETGQPVGDPLKGHTDQVQSVAYSPDGKHIVSGSLDETVRVWDIETRQPVGEPFKGHTEWVWSVAYSPDGKYIASGSTDQTVRIWNAETGRPVGEPFRGHTNRVQSVAYSPDGKHIVSGSPDKTVRIWNAETGQPVREPLKGHTNWVQSVAYSPDGKHIVSGSTDQTVRIWDAETGQPLGVSLKGHTSSVESVAYSPNGKHVVSSSIDCTARIWNSETGQPVEEQLKGHSGGIESVAYSPNGKHVVSSSVDCTVRVWNAETGQPAGEPINVHTRPVRAVAYSPDGRHIVSGSDDKTVRIWNAETWQPVGKPLKGHTHPVDSVAYSPDGKHIVSGSKDKTVRVWNAETGQPAGEPLKGHTHPVDSVAYSPDGKHIVSSSRDKTVRIWNAETGHPVGEPLKGHTRSVGSVAYSPDGKHIVSGSYDLPMRIWNAKTRQPVGEPLTKHTHPVDSVAYSPDGKHIVSGSTDQTVIIWNAETMQPVGEPLKGHTNSVQSVAYAPDGKHIVSGSYDKTVRIWNAEIGQPIAVPLKGHTCPVQLVAFSPDGKHLVSDSTDEKLRVWNMKRWPEIGESSRQHADSVQTPSHFSGTHDHTGHLTPEPAHPLQGHPHFILSSSIHVNVQGWVVSSKGYLLFWLPPQYRPAAAGYRQICTIPADAANQAVHIDYSNFQYGTHWERCWKSM